ncbi:Protein SseB [Cronobacter sakazakii 696]|nr:Protein SseB [Cronobacter sakazakii 696]
MSETKNENNAEKNELETLLEKAAAEPAFRPAFFRTLLESTVWVPGEAADGEAVVAESAVDLQHWEKDDGTSVIPFPALRRPLKRRWKANRRLWRCRCAHSLK